MSAVVRCLSSVTTLVDPQYLLMSESFPTLVTVVQFLSGVNETKRKLPALVTAVRFLSSVSTLVDSQDVLISKIFPTLVTAMGFLSCVDVLMSTVCYWWKEGFLTVVTLVASPYWVTVVRMSWWFLRLSDQEKAGHSWKVSLQCEWGLYESLTVVTFDTFDRDKICFVCVPLFLKQHTKRV